NIPNEINFDDPVKIIYVSNYSMYKNQWEVVKAIDDINSSKIKVKLTLVGGGSGKAKKLTELAIDKMKYPCAVLDVGRCEHFKLPELIKEHDVFLFASSCETISITLLEGMASFKPIISSNKGPMPEVLGNSGVYFDPFSSVDISNAIREVINRDPKVNYKQAKLSYEKSQFYNWKTCAKNTWDFIEKTAKDYL
ncbi:glycosyltransferase, partial [Vibrio owensii]